MIMDEFVTKRSLYHAKTGNFTGFCVSMSSDLNENKLDELYDHFLEIRGKMSIIDPFLVVVFLGFFFAIYYSAKLGL